jgi:tetratricopeptide (TPR) repeat protein
VSADSAVESVPDVITSTIEGAKLKEEINLVGATLKEIIGSEPELSGLKQIFMKNYSLPTPPDDSKIEAVFTAYETKLAGEDWQTIFLRREGDRTLLMFGKEEDGIRNKLLIVLVTPSEISEMIQIGEMELSALDKLRKVIVGSMPTLGEAETLNDFFDTGSSPSQKIRGTIRRLEKIISAKDKNVSSNVSLEDYFRLAASYQQVEEYKKALDIYGFIMKKPDVPEWIRIRTYLGAAESSQRLGRTGDAKSHYEMLINEFGEQTDIVSTAQAAIKHLINRSGSSRAKTPMEKAEELLYVHGEYEKAIDVYQEIINSDPKSSDAESAMYKMGMTYGYMNQPEKKIETFVKAANKYRNPSSYIRLARAYPEVGGYDEALGHYRLIIDAYPDSPESSEAYLGAGECSEALGKIEEAKSYYKKLTEKFRNDERPGVLAEKALIKMERGDARPFLGLGFKFTRSSSEGGVPIVTVFKNGPCKTAGVRRGDVLLAIDSQPTHNARSVIRIIGWEKNIGDKVTLLIRRRGERAVIETRIRRIGEKEIEIPVKTLSKTVEIEIPVVLIKAPEKLER